MMEILYQHAPLLIGVGYALLELCGIVAAIHAVMHVRTAQGAIAWLIALIAMPIVALPLYAVFGRRRFLGYVQARQSDDAAVGMLTAGRADPEHPFRAALNHDERTAGFEKISASVFLRANEASLLIDGEATYQAIFDALATAERYVLVQFYILRDDSTGSRLQQALLDCLARDVRIHLLYDALGSYQLGSAYTAVLRDAGANVASFTGTTRRMRRLQINFRNHRKIVVVDGHTAFVGGHNVGDEYLGRHPSLAPWRDTHVRVKGPAVTAIQRPFLEDWYWSTGELTPVDWHPVAAADDQAVLVLPSSPADALEAGALMFVHAIYTARRRLWIVSPYFVPNGSLIDALKLAALRGVDVRILIAGRSDNALASLASAAYLPELLPAGVRVFRYQRGFLHQKVMLIDDDLAGIGTANLDNRSMRLNFEITLFFAGAHMPDAVERMLVTDFERSTEVQAHQLTGSPWWYRAATRGARLLAPVL